MADAPRAFWSDKAVLCTGASGVVGSWVTALLLAAGAEVVALIRDVDHRSHFYRAGYDRRTSIVYGELQDFATIERAINQYAVDTVIHLGAQTIVGTAQRSPLDTFESNIRGTYHVLEACRQHRSLVQRVVIASSDKAYGDAGEHPYEENGALAANHPYDVSKACTDLLAQTYAHSYDLSIAIARCGNIYGGGDLNWSRIVPGTIRSLLADERPIIRSDGTYVRDYLYVKDAADAYLALAERAGCEGIRGQAFNFSAETPTTVLEIVGTLARLMSKTNIAPLIQNNATNEIPYQLLSSGKARERLNWQPRYPLDAGLRETIDWYTQFFADESAAHAR